MTVTVRGQRAGLTTGDALVVLSLLCLALAVVYPRMATAAFQRRVDEVVSKVETVRTAALASLEEGGAWPAEASPGTLPADLLPWVPGDFSLRGEGYTVDWNLWETVRLPPPEPAEDVLQSMNPTLVSEPPEVVMEAEPAGPSFHPLAAITLHSEDEAILASLLGRYGPRRSFVHGSSWTLVLGEGG